MTIRSYTLSDQKHLTDMMVTYMAELNCDVPEEIIRTKLEELIRQQWEAGILHIAMVFDWQIPIGFSIYQIDSPASDWCKRPGWGFIREFYIATGFRRRGYGAELAVHTQHHLEALGASGLYLTSDTAATFWEACGYRNTHEICSNDLEIFTK